MQHITSLQTVISSDSPLRRSVLDRLFGPYSQDEALINQVAQTVGAEAHAWDTVLRSQVEAGGLALGVERQGRYLSATKPLTLKDVFSAYQAIAAEFRASAGDRRAQVVDMPIESRFRGYVQELVASGAVGAGIPRPITPMTPRKPRIGAQGERKARPNTRGPRKVDGSEARPSAGTAGGGIPGASSGAPRAADPRNGSGRPGAPKRNEKARSGPRPSREAPATRPDPGVTGVIKDPLKFMAQQAAKNRKRNNGVL